MRKLRIREGSGGYWARGMAKSRIRSSLRAYSSLEARFERGAFGGGRGAAGRSLVRRLCLRTRDRSRILGALHTLGRFLLRGSLRSWGSFFLLSSVFCLLGSIAVGRFSVTDVSFVLCVSVGASSVLLFNVRQSLSHALGRSGLAAWLLFSLCRFPEDHFIFGEEEGEDRPWLTLVASILVGAVTAFSHPTVLFLLPAAVLTLALCVAVPELVLLGMLFMLPFLSLFAHTSFILGCLTVLGVSLWLCKLACGHRDTRMGLLGFFVLLFALSILMGGVFGAGGIASFARAALQFLFLSCYFPMRDLFSKQAWRARALFLIALSALAVSTVGIGQYALGLAELKWVDVSRFSDIGGRVTSFFDNPNVLAVYLLLIYPLMLGAGCEKKRPTGGRVLYFLAAITCAICLLLTWSRGAWLGAIAATLLFFLFYSRQSAKALLWSALPIAIWTPLLPHSIVNRFSSICSLAEGSIRYRLYTWQGTLSMLWVHPFGIGVGEEAFARVWRSFAVSGTETVTHTHDLLLQIAAELGVGGVLCFLTVVALFFCRVSEHLHRTRKMGDRAVTLGGFCAVVGVLIMGIFDNVWYHYGLFWLFWMIMAATEGGNANETGTQNELV